MVWDKRKDLTATLVIILVMFASVTLYFQRVRGMGIVDSATLVGIIMVPMLVVGLLGVIVGILILRGTGRESLW